MILGRKIACDDDKKNEMLLRLASTSGGISSTDDTALDGMSLNALAESLAQNCGNVF